MFSYGSGAECEMFSIKVLKDYKEYVNCKKHHEMIDDRIEVDYNTYKNLLNAFMIRERSLNCKLSEKNNNQIELNKQTAQKVEEKAEEKEREAEEEKDDVKVGTKTISKIRNMLYILLKPTKYLAQKKIDAILHKTGHMLENIETLKLVEIANGKRIYKNCL